MEIVVAVIAGMFSVCVAIFGAVLVNINNTKMQTRKLKEEHYVNYLEAIHNLAEDNKSSQALKAYTLHSDKMFIIASEGIVNAMLKYEDIAVGKSSNEHDQYLTQLIIEIRKDLKIKDKNYPQIYLKKANNK